MNEITYAKVYTEVLEILNHLPKAQYNKIPKEKIEFYKNNCDTSYNFKLQKDLKSVSTKANAIIISLYRDYFASEKQQETLSNILVTNTRKAEELKREKYNPDDLFKKNLEQQEVVKKENVQMIEYKEETVFQKIWGKLRNFLHYLKNR